MSVSVVELVQYLYTADPAMYKLLILHSNNKHPNILLDSDWLVCLMEVGLARMHQVDCLHVTLVQFGGTAGFLDLTTCRQGSMTLPLTHSCWG